MSNDTKRYPDDGMQKPVAIVLSKEALSELELKANTMELKRNELIWQIRYGVARRCPFPWASVSSAFRDSRCRTSRWPCRPAPSFHGTSSVPVASPSCFPALRRTGWHSPFAGNRGHGAVAARRGVDLDPGDRGGDGRRPARGDAGARPPGRQVGRQSRGPGAATRESGQWKGHSFIRGGRARVRRLLYMVTFTAVRHQPDLARKYDELRARGKPPKVALAVVMRKLVVLANALGAGPDVVAECGDGPSPVQGR